MNQQPTQLNERIVSLDILRGFAVLGILVMNIQMFSSIREAYYNPTVYGDFEGINRIIWVIKHVFFQSKFLSLFSLLFGAGIVLFTSRLKAKGYKSIGIHYRRMLWLLVFGLIHAYLIWFGDILVSYALCGMYLVWMRNWKPRNLLITGIGFILLLSFYVTIVTVFVFPNLSEAEIATLREGYQSTADLIKNEIASFSGNWLEQLPLRAKYALDSESSFLANGVGMYGGIMLIGMALYKWGILSGEKSKKFYVKLSSICLVIGLLMDGWRTKSLLDSDFEFFEYNSFGLLFHLWGSLLISIGYVGLIMLLVKSNILELLKKSLQAVGQMAFTNYLMQSIICTFIFYGHGFGLFGKIEKTEQLIYIFLVMLLQLIYSPIWLKYFKYGPFEWAWRSLTYWKVQAIKR